MSNREACELWIEQEIETGLEAGKKPYSIGKELAAMVERLFETKMNPETIRSRVRRKDTGQMTGKESNPIENIEDTVPDIIKDRKSQGGGKRKNAGRPRSQKILWKAVNKRLNDTIEYMNGAAIWPPPGDLENKVNATMRTLEIFTGVHE